MNAAEAREISTTNARDIAAKEAVEREKKRVANLKAKISSRKKFLELFELKCRDTIKYRTEDGKKKAEITLSEDNEDMGARIDYDHRHWAPMGKDGPLSIWGSDYLKHSCRRLEIKAVMAKLRRDGYRVAIEDRLVEHDTSAAYMNSGGECGSETPWWTRDTVLVITW